MEGREGGVKGGRGTNDDGFSEIDKAIHSICRPSLKKFKLEPAGLDSSPLSMQSHSTSSTR